MAAAAQRADKPGRTFQSLAKKSVALQTVEAIKEMIRSGDLGPHQALPPERELARALNISRPTLREAIGALTAMNILESHHGDGTFVTGLTPELLSGPIAFMLQIDPSNAGHLNDVVRGMEIEATRLAATRIAPEELRVLESLAREPGEAAPARFHQAIVAATHNPLYRQLHTTVARLAATDDAAGNREYGERVSEDHLAIVRALRRRAPKAAAEAMLVHLGRDDGEPRGAAEAEKDEA